MVFILFILGLLIAALVLTLVFAPMLIDQQEIVALAQEQVRKATGGELTIDGDIELSLLPSVVLVLDQATIDLPPQGDGGSRVLASIDDIDIGLSLVAAIKGGDSLGDITLSGADIQIFDPDGSVSASLTVPSMVVQGLNLSDQPIGLDGGVNINLPESSQTILVDIAGSIRVPSSIERVTIDKMDVVIDGALSETLSAGLTGRVVLAPMDADLDLTLTTPGGVIDADLLYQVRNSPQIDAAFRADRLDLDSIQPASSATPSPESDGTAARDAEPSTQVPPVPVPVGPLRDLDLQLSVDAKSLVTSGQEISNAQVLFRVVDGISDMKYLRGVLHQGQLDTRMKIDARKPDIKATIDGGMKGVQIDSLLTSVGSPGTAVGRVDMAWDIESTGVTPQDLQLNVDGQLAVDGLNVEITALGVQGLLCEAAAQIQQKPLTNGMPSTTPINKMALRINLGDGLATISNLNLASPGVDLEGKASVGLSDQVVKARVAATLGEELENIDPACALNDRYKDVEWPVICLGKIGEDPKSWCKVDVESIATQLLENEAKSRLQKEVDKLGEEAGGFIKKLFGD
jgi:AsmA protein